MKREELQHIFFIVELIVLRKWRIDMSSQDLQFIKEYLMSSHVPENEIDTFLLDSNYVTYLKNSVIFHQTEICDKVLIITDGIAAAETAMEEKAIITRFFQKGDTCINIISAFTGELGVDNIISLTPVRGVLIDIDIFLKTYHSDTKLGRFLREYLLKDMVEYKKLTSAKILYSSDRLDLFLRELYPEVISRVASKYIAMFMGITPEAYSRLLGKRIHKS